MSNTKIENESFRNTTDQMVASIYPMVLTDGTDKKPFFIKLGISNTLLGPDGKRTRKFSSYSKAHSAMVEYKNSLTS